MTRDELIERLKSIGEGTDQVMLESWGEDEYGYSCTVEEEIMEVGSSYRKPNRIVIS